MVVNTFKYMALGAMLSTLALVGCSDDDRPKRPFVLYVPPQMPTDMDPDLVDVPSDLPAGDMDEGCVGANDGAQCPLENASGVCVSGQCQLFACVFGFKDCDGVSDNGCEQDVSVPTSCGSCLRSCRAQETCQFGPRGYVCSAGVVCPDGRFDMDQRVDNGCEWLISQEEPTATQPGVLFSVQVGATLADDQFVIAGRDAQSRFLLSHWTDPMQLMPLVDQLNVPLDVVDASSIAFKPDVSGALVGIVGWDDGQITSARLLGNMGSIRTQEARCQLETFTNTISNVAVAERGDWVSYIHGRSIVMTPNTPACLVEGTCDSLTQVFGEADYMRAFYPYANRQTLVAGAQVAPELLQFESSEVAACQQCALSLETGQFVEDRRCWSESQCRDASFDVLAQCTQCTSRPQQCPTFQPVDVAIDTERDEFVFFTGRGVVVAQLTAQGWTPLARLESAFDPDVADLPVVVAGDVRFAQDETTIAYWHKDGFLRVMRLDGQGTTRRLIPVAADIGLRFNQPNAKIKVVLGRRNTVAITDGNVLYIVGLRPQSAKIHRVLLTNSINAFSILDIRATEDGFEVLREELNQVLKRIIQLDAP